MHLVNLISAMLGIAFVTGLVGWVLSLADDGEARFWYCLWSGNDWDEEAGQD